MQLTSEISPNLKNQREKLIEHALGILLKLSRTINAEGNTDISPLKQKPILTGEKLSIQVEKNFKAAVLNLIDSLSSGLTSAESTKQLIIVTANAINAGIVSEQHDFFRTWDGHSNQVKLPELQSEFDSFCQDLYDRKNEIFTDPASLAAHCEYEFNIRIHPLADGCGRTSIALATAILICSNLPYPEFESREEYFRNALIGKEHWIRYYLGKVDYF